MKCVRQNRFFFRLQIMLKVIVYSVFSISFWFSKLELPCYFFKDEFINYAILSPFSMCTYENSKSALFNRKRKLKKEEEETTTKKKKKHESS